MGFTVGDAIVYGGSGVCEIEDIRDISFYRERPQKYYVLKPLFSAQSAVMYVPMSNKEQVSKIHPVMSKDEAMSIIKKIPIPGVKWIEDRNERKETFNGIVNDGKREDIVRAADFSTFNASNRLTAEILALKGRKVYFMSAFLDRM